MKCLEMHSKLALFLRRSWRFDSHAHILLPFYMRKKENISNRCTFCSGTNKLRHISHNKRTKWHEQKSTIPFFFFVSKSIELENTDNFMLLHSQKWYVSIWSSFLIVTLVLNRRTHTHTQYLITTGKLEWPIIYK